jgi:hypothetical protein
VNHVFCSKLAGSRIDSMSSWKRGEVRGQGFALFKDLGTAGTVNCSINSSATEQRRVRGVHDCVGRFARDVTDQKNDRGSMRE